MGSRVSRKNKNNDVNDLFCHDVLSPRSEELEIVSLENSSLNSLGSNNKETVFKMSSYFKSDEIKPDTKPIAIPITRIHQHDYSVRRSLSPTRVLEHLVRETLPNLAEISQTQMFFSDLNRFEKVVFNTKEEKASLSNKSDSGDASSEQESSIKLPDQEEEEIIIEGKMQLISDYQKFCKLLRPQLEALLNGLILKKVPFTFQDYKRLLFEYGIINVEEIIERGLSIKYEPQIVVIQNESQIIYDQSKRENFESPNRCSTSAQTNSIYYVDGKCFLNNNEN